MHVISNDGRKLFSGSRHDCKQFIRKNNIKQYKFKEHFAEVVETPKVSFTSKKVVVEEENTFNKVFEDDAQYLE